MFSSLESNETQESHEEAIGRSLRERLKGICAKMSAEDFEALISTMVREQLRGERSSRR